jgi:predicted peptidase
MWRGAMRFLGPVMAAVLLTSTAGCVAMPTGGTSTSNSAGAPHPDRTGTRNEQRSANANTEPPAAAKGKVGDVAPGQHALVFDSPSAPGVTVNYLLYLPPGYEERGATFPLILYLHGRSLRGDDIELIKKYGLPRRLERETAFPFIVVSPQLRLPDRWTDLATLVALVDDIEKRYPVDRSRVYLTGFSMGAGGAWNLADAHPERFAAVAPLAGTYQPGSRKGLARIPVWAFHGSDDTSTPVGDSERMVNEIRAAGGDAKLTILTGRGHDIADVYDGQELYDWFLAHHR